MSAERFYQRASALQAKGALALLSRREIGALTDEGKAASQRARANQEAAVAAGRGARFCPPRRGQAALTSDELMRVLAAIPSAERTRIDMTEVMTRIFASKFPC
ncbi:MAG: hypothetical protein B7Z08_09940 [Sphingomonadales bacterium 32-68-7]|nr:MAG: hypothetical protein B7Z33_00320 [Sphingomonadales bacterium 12-68-11]OYX08375.1 MAG: hypothetical protein B7Z08_09940 [Sphingomonadales bacterium 32-68-7]